MNNNIEYKVEVASTKLEQKIFDLHSDFLHATTKKEKLSIYKEIQELKKEVEKMRGLINE